MKTIEVYSDFACPHCYVGHHRIAEAIRHSEHDFVAVNFRAFQLNPTLPDSGIPRDVYRERKFGSIEHSHKLDAMVAKDAEKHGISFNFDQIKFAPNTRCAHRAIKLAEVGGLDATRLYKKIFSAYFVEGLDIGDPEVLIRLTAELNLKFTIQQLQGAPSYVHSDMDARIEADIARAHTLGLTGVPFVVLLDNNEARQISVDAAVNLLNNLN